MDLPKLFEETLNELNPNGIEWELVGILTRESRVYTLSYDSKILSGIFEILCEPVVREIAEKNNMILQKAAQNKYPEFTLIPKNGGMKVAIDMKTTYRKRNKSGNLSPFSFTLGSYRSYLQDPKKGILYPYDEYEEHWVIGFVYDRNPKCDATDIKSIIEASSLEAPYSNIEYFVQQKYRIAGDKSAGSGNTTNISSFKSNNIQDFRDGNGPFSNVNEFENYWKNFTPKPKIKKN